MARRPRIESSGFYHSKKVKSQTPTPKYFDDIDVKEYSDMFIKKRAEFLENDDFREVA